MPSTDLITLDAYKAAVGETSPRHDIQSLSAIAAASEVCRSYADRSFGLAQVTETRTFDYDGSGILDIDDAVSVTSVAVVGQPTGVADYPLTADQWRAVPFRNTIFDTIILVGFGGYGSPEMGFRQNLDVLAYEGRGGFLPSQVKVTAVWGWPSPLPGDIQQAAVWTAANIASSAAPYISESIEGYSRTLMPAPPFAVPPRGQALLDPWARVIS